jgi:hypothetical protein
MIENDRKLGKNQREFMSLLRAHTGVWHRGSKWVWKAPSETIRLLEALERRGYAEHSEDSGRWRMTSAGRAALKHAETEDSMGHAHAA